MQTKIYQSQTMARAFRSNCIVVHRMSSKNVFHSENVECSLIKLKI